MVLKLSCNQLIRGREWKQDRRIMEELEMENRRSKTGSLITIAALVFAAAVCFFGRISVAYGQDSFTVKATFAGSDTVSYESIESVKYLESYDGGTRSLGVGSFVLNAGTFQNADYGSYKRYTYTNCPSCVEIRAGGRVYLVNGKDAAETKSIYERLAPYAQQEA